MQVRQHPDGLWAPAGWADVVQPVAADLFREGQQEHAALRAALLQALADAATRFEPDSNVTPKSAGFKRVMTIIRDLQRWGTYIPAVTGASRNLLSTMVSAQRHEGAFLTRLFDYQHTYVVSCC